jgi:RNA polymerase sigma factor (sigma-70 family)
MRTGLRAVSEWSSGAVDSSSKPAGPSRNGSPPSAQKTSSARSSSSDERFARLYMELQRPARAMVRRAFGSMFSDAEIEDVYGNAWLGTLRALRDRRPELSEEELRKYVLTAVANHASKELRRRGRRPTTPIEFAPEVADGNAPPDERAASREQSQVAREILSTLPQRRRAVMMLRYGWGLKPEEVCGLVKGLSPRAYRKEITRGVDEVSAKLRLVEEGRWCDDREPVLKAYAAGIASSDQQRQAEQHLAHCRPCGEYVGKLSGRLHEIGSSVAWTGVAHAVDDRSISIVDRVGGALDRARDAVAGRGGPDSSEVAASQLASSGAGRGAGAAGAGVLAKIAGAGAVPKLLAACLTGGVAATCIAAGVGPGAELAALDEQVAERPVDQSHDKPKPPEPPDSRPVQVAQEEPPLSDAGQQPAAPAPEPAPTPEPAPAPPAPAEAEFGIAPSATSDGGSSSEFGVGSSSGGSAGGSAGAEFGP